MQRIIGFATWAAMLMIAPAEAANVEQVSSWANLPVDRISKAHLNLTIAGGSHVKGNLLDIRAGEFVLGDPKSRRIVRFDQVVKVDATVKSRDAFGDYCFWAFLVPALALGNPMDWLLLPVWVAWEAGGLVALPVVAPILLHKGHTYSFTLAQP